MDIKEYPCACEMQCGSKVKVETDEEGSYVRIGLVSSTRSFPGVLLLNYGQAKELRKQLKRWMKAHDANA